MKTYVKQSLDQTTEEKIKLAAEKLFMERGFSGTRTRDIAESADINLALLNYYYRSKENLFNIIMMEKWEIFFDIIINTLQDKSLDFPKKISILTNEYYDLLMKDPKLPLFLMSEIQQNPDLFIEKLNIRAKTQNLIFAVDNEEMEIQLLLDFMSLTFFPFVLRDALEKVFALNHEQYDEVLNKRKDYLVQNIVTIYSKLVEK
ncbi:MAG: TetR/AcrR family transcriptional regulator [Paludibacteraceae bacterium]